MQSYRHLAVSTKTFLCGISYSRVPVLWIQLACLEENRWDFWSIRCGKNQFLIEKIVARVPRGQPTTLSIERALHLSVDPHLFWYKSHNRLASLCKWLPTHSRSDLLTSVANLSTWENTSLEKIHCTKRCPRSLFKGSFNLEPIRDTYFLCLIKNFKNRHIILYKPTVIILY